MVKGIVAKNLGPMLKMSKEFEKLTDSNPLYRLFPSIFTATMFVVFIIPSFTLYYMCKQPAVNYWIEDKSGWVFIVPLLMSLTHQYHLKKGPGKMVTTMSLVIPSVVIFTICMITTENAKGIAQELFSIDCDITREKAMLQLEWEAANSFYSQCLKNTEQHSPYTLQYLEKTFRINDCAHYEAVHVRHQKAWDYLRNMEEGYQCTGWCVPNRPLWTAGRHLDSCSVAASRVFDYFVGVRTERIVALMFLIFVPSISLLGVLKPLLEAIGYDFKW
jgi:hypothetical protein